MCFRIRNIFTNLFYCHISWLRWYYHSYINNEEKAYFKKIKFPPQCGGAPADDLQNTNEGSHRREQILPQNLNTEIWSKCPLCSFVLWIFTQNINIKSHLIFQVDGILLLKKLSKNIAPQGHSDNQCCLLWFSHVNISTCMNEVLHLLPFHYRVLFWEHSGFYLSLATVILLSLLLSFFSFLAKRKNMYFYCKCRSVTLNFMFNRSFFGWPLYAKIVGIRHGLDQLSEMNECMVCILRLAMPHPCNGTSSLWSTCDFVLCIL